MKTSWTRRFAVRAILSIACALVLPTAHAASLATKSNAAVEITVYAATSTRDALSAIDAKYSQDVGDAGVKLVFNFGSSGDLSKQIIAAAKADVFLSADEKEMDRLAAAKLVLDGTRRDLLSNQLVVIEPIDPQKPQSSIFTKPFTPAQLASPAVQHLSLGNVESVPAGRYAKAWLEKTGTWKDVADRVLPAVDVRAALAAVESAGAQAGIVYKTDVARSKKARIVFAVPTSEGPQITYPVAVLTGRPAEKEARAFVEYLASPASTEIFEKHGFVALRAKAASSAK